MENMESLAPFLPHDACDSLYPRCTSRMLPSQEFDGRNAFLGRLGEPVGEIVPDGRIRIQIAFFDGLLNHCPTYRIGPNNRVSALLQGLGIGLSAISDFVFMIPCCGLRSQLSPGPGVSLPKDAPACVSWDFHLSRLESRAMGSAPKYG